MFRDLLARLRIDMYSLFRAESHLPCYINRATVTDNIEKMADIRAFIEGCKEHKNNTIGVLLFSVTENDKWHKKWLKIAEQENYQVVSGPSIHGDYQCWSIFVPNDKLEWMRHR